MDEMLPQWPSTAPRCGPVVLRAFAERDVHLAFELGDDPYVPLIGSLAAKPSEQEAMDWIHRQQSKLADGAGMSFAIADARTDQAVGAIGLWLRNLAAGRATAGYSVAATHRGRGVASSALKALTGFVWAIPALHRVELHIEPWNLGSVRVAENAGYQREGLMRSHQEIGGVRRDMPLHATVRAAVAGPDAPVVHLDDPGGLPECPKITRDPSTATGRP
ncbi:GNAT family N-acetyltransferase [Actinokineospora xionganensis]|uniref:GNAT family N-acetyltransferase n=1 Tax=Actinokineospora xionganensis TaxID=2684470 RepID=A0ABR7L0W4_9PSEU|nr:GNAT family protein [Actinokineospora xionganensis]MBC6446232.1 GNAT family N-acetyltransferase [Actinokineospora xionganensis]